MLVWAVTWLEPIMPILMAAKKPKEVSVSVFWKIVLPVALIAIILCVFGIALMAILDLMKKTEKLDDPSEKYGDLPVGEMSFFENKSRIAPLPGKVIAVVFLILLQAFYFAGFYTMGRGASTTKKLRDEGKRKQARLDKDRKARKTSSGEIGEDEGPMKATGSDFGAGMFGKFGMK